MNGHDVDRKWFNFGVPKKSVIFVVWFQYPIPQTKKKEPEGVYLHIEIANQYNGQNKIPPEPQKKLLHKKNAKYQDK